MTLKRIISVASIAALVSVGAFAHEGKQHPEPVVARPADALPGIGHHDHTPLHGGLVMMSSDDHVELLAEPNGVYRLWYSDGWRRPLKDGVKATIVVKSAQGEETLQLAPTGSADGELRAQGKVQDGVARTVFLDGFAHGYPVKQQFEIRPVFDVKVGVPVDMEVTESGFVPANLKVTAGKKVTLRVTRKTDATCAKEIVVPGYVEKTALPLGKTVVVSFTPKKSGTIRYGCAMNQMLGGVIFVP